jgi:oligopeptide/dipeptide ABC transporter ATP-binding protein
MTQENEPILQVSNLNVIYVTGGGNLHALKDVDFDIWKGETLGVLGESGAGKSTIGMALLGLIEPPSRTEGKMLFLGRDITNINSQDLEKYRWRDVAIIFQAAMNSLDPVVTVGKNFVEVLRAKKIARTKAEAVSLSRRLLSTVGLPDSVFGTFPFELSGGMKQRVMIAMAIAANPKLLIADEPTTALDTITQFSILQLVKKLKEEGTLQSVLLISHDLSVQIFMVDRLVVMLRGRIVETALKEEIVENPLHPYTKLLLGTLRGESIRAVKNAIETPDENACPFATQCPHVMAKCTRGMPSTFEVAKNHTVACYLYGD